MDAESKIFLDEILHQVVNINKNLSYIVEQIAVDRALQRNTLRKGSADDASKLL